MSGVKAGDRHDDAPEFAGTETRDGATYWGKPERLYLRRLTAVACIVLGCGFTSAVSAAPGRCVLRVDGHTYLNGPCDIDLEAGGDFKISPLREVDPYYVAYVTLTGSSPGTATGSWNGKEAESHAHDDLGTLTRKGACWSNAHAEICAVATAAQGQALPAAQTPPAPSDIVYPDLPAPGNRVVFQYTDENTPVEIMVKPGNLATLVLYNGQIAFRLRSEDYPGPVTVQGPITGPEAPYDVNKPPMVKKGSAAYVLIVAKTGASTCTQHGFIMDVTGAIPIVTSKLDLCSPEAPKVGIKQDGTIELLAKSWEPPGFGSIMKMPAQKYDFRTGDADYVKMNLPDAPVQAGGKRPVRK